MTVETNATIYVEECAGWPTFLVFHQIIRLCSSAPYADHHNNTRSNIPAIQSFITHAARKQKTFN